jgi:hypothetical protein
VAPALEDEGLRNGGPAHGTELEKSIWDGWTQNAPRSVNREVPAIKQAGPAVERASLAGNGPQEDEGCRTKQPKQEQRPGSGVPGNKASVKAAPGKSDAAVKVQALAKGSKGGMKLAVKKVVKSNVELMRERLSLMMQ